MYLIFCTFQQKINRGIFVFYIKTNIQAKDKFGIKMLGNVYIRKRSIGVDFVEVS